MAGRRRTGAFAGTLSGLVKESVDRRYEREEYDRRRGMKNEDEESDLRRRLIEAGIKARIERGELPFKAQYASQLQAQKDAAAAERQQSQQGFTADQNELDRQSQAQVGMMKSAMSRDDLSPILNQLGLSDVFEQREPETFDTSTLKPGQSYSQEVPGGRLTTHGPQMIDPALNAGRVAGLQQQLQDIKQKDAYAQAMAQATIDKTMAEAHAAQSKWWNPYSWKRPESPKVEGVEPMDTSWLESQLGRLMSDAPIAPPSTQGMGQTLRFNSVEEAEQANLPPGTRVIIQGRPAIIE